MDLQIASADEMRTIGRAFGQALLATRQLPLLVELRGELGAGKTTFVSGLLNGLGISGYARSPTYTLIEPYELADRQIYHLDLYRLASADEVEALGLRDLLTPQSALLVEWPERGAGWLPPGDLVVHIRYPEQGEGREMKVTAMSAAAKELMAWVQSAVEP